MEIYKLRFNTSSKSADEIKASYDSNHPSTEVLEKMAEAFRNLNNTEVVGAEWDYSPNTYSVYGWDDNDDEKFKELIYWIEQDDFFGSYNDDRNRFETDWKAGDYEPAAALHFDKSDFVVIEKINREGEEAQ
ncbi:hypothetical protein NYE33_20350 [Paenibacillus sp. FSL R10-2199]|uniref:hypothetical protein n=1 Tax=Paenibacillus sp. FSL R10-2199 TaxID=2975348 RepID=UPI0030FC9E6A